MPAALLILAGMIGVALLAYVGVIGGFVALIGEIAIVLAAAWLFDRGRRIGARDPYLDANRADVPANGGATIRQVPTEAVQSPSERGSPS
jgi:hypothetical protein